MIGFIFKYRGEVHRLGSDTNSITLIATIVRDFLIIDHFSYTWLEEGAEMEIEVAEFDEPTSPYPPEYFINNQVVSDNDVKESDLKWKLKELKMLEEILKAEGVI